MKAGYIRLDSVRIGAAELTRQAAKVLPWSDQSNDRGARAPRAGILGLELFERFRVTIDRSRQTVTLQAPGGGKLSSPWVAVPITFDEDAPLIDGSFCNVHGPFMIDTGNAGSTIISNTGRSSRASIECSIRYYLPART